MDRRLLLSLLLSSLEFSRGQISGCFHGQWQCDDGSCVPDVLRCDGEGDCLDGTDEMNCPGSLECPWGQFACLDTVGCVDTSARCDGQIQCPTGSDEESCPAVDGCLDSEWMCANRMCITEELRCNGRDDCMDNSDEDDCGVCTQSGVRCPGGTCLSADKRCDGQFDCSDGSDEPLTCGRICAINNGGCSHVCADEPWGTRCTCPAGHTLSPNGLVCEDLDECAAPFPPCPHYCINTPGSYYCRCRDGFKLWEGATCLASGNGTRLLMVQRSTLGLFNVMSEQFDVIHTSVAEPVALAFDIGRRWYYWADRTGKIYKSDGQQSWTAYSGEPGIIGLACDWLNGNLFWTNQKTKSIYMQAPDGRSYTVVLRKNISPFELVLVPVKSSMFWINAGPGDRETIEKSWMDGSERSSLTVITTQSAHSLTADVVAMRLYWISDFKRSIETVMMDGSGRYSFTGLFSGGRALSLAVFESVFYWVDERGLWQVAQNQPNKKKSLLQTDLPLLAAYHEMQQPRGSSACTKTDCLLCQLTDSNFDGYTCSCPNSKLLLHDGSCEYPRFLYNTAETISLVEYRGRDNFDTELFTTKDGILSFDLDLERDLLYWVNQTGHIQRTGHKAGDIEAVPADLPVCFITLDQTSGSVFWVSCDQHTIGTAAAERSQNLYSTTRAIRDLHLDWMGRLMYWLEGDRVLSMSLTEGKTNELLQIAGGFRESVAFDLRANSLLWNSKQAGLTKLSLLLERRHEAGRRWNISGSAAAALEPYLLTVSDHVINLWDQRDGSLIQQTTVKEPVSAAVALVGKLKTVLSYAACNEPSVLCRHSSLCLPQAQLCDGKTDCPEGDDEELCVWTCPSKEDFRCGDRRSCISRNLVCDGRAHCRDGSDEVDCSTVASLVTRATTLKCRMGSKPCSDGKECVLFSHVCDGEKDCRDGSDELECVTTTAAKPKNNQIDGRLADSGPACVSPSVKCPTARICVYPQQFCDGKKDCPDGFDENSCLKKCPSNIDFLCEDRRSCISRSQVCDGQSNCYDGSDEAVCSNVAASPQTTLKCRLGSRLCRDGTECVLYSHVCDGDPDCRDGSDELGCESMNPVIKNPQLNNSPVPVKPVTEPPTKPPCSSPSVLCPGSSVCLSPAQICDGKKDCPDGSDEKCVQRCLYRTDFLCRDRRKCVSKSQVCDGRSDCNDGSDEVDCPSVDIPAPQKAVLKCSLGSRLCQDGTECVLYSHICDGDTDCRDGSDELRCDDPSKKALTGPPTKPPCTSPSVVCPGSSVCLSPAQICDGKKDCPDGSDEKCLQRCPYRTDFLCKDRRSCISRSQVCDGRAHCNDGSDEIGCSDGAPPTPAKTTLKCRLGSRLCQDGTECVLYSHICDGDTDCRDGSDELGCDDPSKKALTEPPTKPPCSSPSVVCPGSSVCLSPAQICDGKKDCPDGSDEKCVKRCPYRTDFLCKDRQSCVSKSKVCDGRADCRDGSDEVGCPGVTLPPPRKTWLQCRLGSRLCQDGTECVLYSHICDGDTDCRDGSDELGCEAVTSVAVEKSPSSISREAVEPVTEPPTKPPCTSPSVVCPGSSVCLSPAQICDGKKDCPDGFDEKCVKRCPYRTDFLCKDRRSCISRSQVCDGRAHCNDGSDEIGCSDGAPPTPAKTTLKCRLGSRLCQDGTECVLYSHICDGDTDCRDGSDELGCDEKSAASVEENSHLSDSPSSNEPVTKPPTKPPCTSPSVVCPGSSVCLSPAQICDGKKDCPDGSDEKCVQRCPYWSDFRCKDRRSCVSKSQVCDGRSDCHDGSDEVNCPSVDLPAPSTEKVTLKCRLGSRLCQDGTECVLYSHICDGDTDCRDGSDEAGCDVAESDTSIVGNPTQNNKPATEPPTKPPCTSPSVLCPGSSVCLSPAQICDGKKDCPDGSDEKCVKRCPYWSDFRCKDRRSCISQKKVCDGRSDCNDGSDEVDCPSVDIPAPQKTVLNCRLGSRLCQDGTECVLYSHICDGDTDCRDGSDELGCDSPSNKTLTGPPTKPPCTSPSVVCPGSSVCLSPAQICDGKKDCPDGSDEKCVQRCPFWTDFLCKDRRSCISRSQVCDGRAHCNDGSDEIGCSDGAPPTPAKTTLKCRLGSRLCQDGTECVLYSHICDGDADCRDGSDELGCDVLEVTTSTKKPSTRPQCRSPSVLCPGSAVCVTPAQLCDGRQDCPDGSDEDCVKKCADQTDFLCKDRRSCVSRSLVCDGRSHCRDGSDELDCLSGAPPTPRTRVLACRIGSKLCDDGTECVLNSHLCDGEDDCPDGSDERGCTATCETGDFQCAHGRMCIPEAQVCDGRSQCRDNSDEMNCWKPTKTCEHRCADGKRCLPKKLLCDGERDCPDGSDELGCDAAVAAAGESSALASASVCAAPSVPCPGSARCIVQQQLCDGKRDCPDGSDESGCVLKCENPNDFLCSDQRKCIQMKEVCDGQIHCPDGSDEKRCTPQKDTATSSNVPNSPSEPLKCRRGFKPCEDGLECVMYSHVCDGEEDCKDGSDEVGCATKCKDGEFLCAHGSRCITQSRVCDGQYDCQDRSDEKDCSARIDGCHHHCDNKTRCIPDTFLCDGEKDCADGSDEETCGSVTCLKDQYRCASGQCVFEALRCDGYADCSDRSDEAGCSRPPRCPVQLRCPHSHECLQKEWLCDGEKDCKDGSDEMNCNTPPAKCRSYQWQCRDSTQCVPVLWRCDGVADCHNGMDEDRCTKKNCPSHLYQCGSGECIDPKLVCNGLSNCIDGSDEGVGCGRRNCSSPAAPQCDHLCVTTPVGPTCFCTSGFRPQFNARTCVDVDECNSEPRALCEHTCLNTRGSYTCHCHPGFYLEPDNKSCKTKDEPLLLASVQSELLLFGVHSGTLRIFSSVSQPVFSLDYHWGQQRVYWLSPDYQSIRFADMNNPNNKRTLIKGVKSDFLAVDWVGNNLYWVDGLVGQILAVKLSNTTLRSQDYAVVLGEDLEQPSSLVLLPHKGLMLWSEIGSKPQIEQSGMDGSRRKVVVSSDLSWPVSLAYDLLDNRMYWADEKLRCIGSASLDGDNIKILQLAETPNPFSVVVFNDRVFWSDTKRRAVRSAKKNTGKDQKVLLKRPGQPFGLKLMHALSQPAVSHPCDKLSCSHLCLLAPAASGSSELSAPIGVCRCPKGLLLSRDKITCSVPTDSSFVLFLSRNTIYQIYLRSMRRDGVSLKKMPNNRPLALPNTNEALELDVSIRDLSLYVAYSGQGSVDVLRLGSSRSRQGLTRVDHLLQLKDDMVTALAVDWITRNLYWSSIEWPDVHVTSRYQAHTTSLMQGSLMGTTSIALHPPTGRLCYTAMVKVSGRAQTEVVCAWMDGRNKAVLWRKSRIPTSLVFSDQGNMIYWADTGESMISSIGLDGTGYKQFTTGPGLLLSFTHAGNIFLWVTLGKDVTRVWFTDGLQPKQLWFETKSSIVKIRAFGNDTQAGTNRCLKNNGDCEHLCLPYPGGRTCKCGRGFVSVNGTSCSPLPSCPAGEKPCFRGDKCISSSKFCDNRVDCPDQSDEQDCPSSNVASSGSKTSKDETPQSSNAKNSILSVKKDSPSCDLQHCNGHGRCITEGKVTRCQCLQGYKGESCHEVDHGHHHAPVILCVFFLVVLVVTGIFIFAKRRRWAALRQRSTDKENLMANMGLPSEDESSDSEEVESPVDMLPPSVPLVTVSEKDSTFTDEPVTG